jgi:hypothetical protein
VSNSGRGSAGGLFGTESEELWKLKRKINITITR